MSDFYDQDTSNWTSENTGDGSYVPMGTGDYKTYMGKLSFNMGNIKYSLMRNVNSGQSQGYSHIYKYNPDGRSYQDTKTTLDMFQLNHFLNEKMFYDIRASRTNNYYGSYVFKDFDSYRVWTKMVFIREYIILQVTRFIITYMINT